MTEAAAFLAQLAGGDRRSIGRADAVAAQVLADPARFAALWRGLDHADSLVRMRAADALEKTTRRQPGWLAPFKADFLRRLADAEQMEVRWHLAQMAPRLAYTAQELGDALALLECLLGDASRIVQVSAMQAIADLSLSDPARRRRARTLIAACMWTGSPAVKARGRKLLTRLDETGGGHG